MIYGIGTDITEVRRFVKWAADPGMIIRFFNKNEVMDQGSDAARCQHYAVRFAAKEAFSKALGTGITGFELRDVFIKKNKEGRPELCVQGSARSLFNRRCPNGRIFVSLSHEKEYAVAVVVIDTE